MSNLEPLVIMLSAPISSEAPHGLFAASLVVVWAIDIAGPIRSPRTPASPNTATIRVMTHLPPPRVRMLILAGDLLMLTPCHPDCQETPSFDHVCGSNATGSITSTD